MSVIGGRCGTEPGPIESLPHQPTVTDDEGLTGHRVGQKCGAEQRRLS